MRNVITRSLGYQEDVEVDLTVRAIRRGDQYLLCSDGLSGLVEDAAIAEEVGRADPEASARNLVERANREGGTDNITVQVAVIPDNPKDAGSPVGAGGRSGAWVWGVGIGLAGALAWLFLGGR